MARWTEGIFPRTATARCIASGLEFERSCCGPGDVVKPNSKYFLYAMLYSLKPQYWVGAKWVMNRSTMQTIATFKDSGGRYVLNPVAAPGAPPNLLGYDVVICFVRPRGGL
jgi:hypothetical protein